METEIQWWWVGLGVWVIAGIGFACLFLLMERRSRSSEDLCLNIFVAMVVAVAAPIIALYCIGLVFWMLAHGEIPLTNRRLWGKADDTETGRPEGALVDMIALRRRSDPNLKRKPHPNNWIMADLWTTPEAAILEIVELSSFLRFDGFTDHEIIERIEAWRSALVERPEPPPADIDSYIRYRIECEAPEYPLSDHKLFERTLERARAFADASIRMAKARDSIPRDWLKEQIALIDLDRRLGAMRQLPGGPGGLLLSPKRREVARIKLRMRPEDELWIYESPPETWKHLSGRRGIALVREHKPIENFVLVMN